MVGLCVSDPFLFENISRYVYVFIFLFKIKDSAEAHSKSYHFLCLCESWNLHISAFTQSVHMAWHLGLFFIHLVPSLHYQLGLCEQSCTHVILPITECLWGRFLHHRMKTGCIPIYIFLKEKNHSTGTVTLCMLVIKVCGSIYHR